MSKPKHSPPANPRRTKLGAVDLETLAVDDAWLIRKVKSTRDTTPLIEYLRDGRGKVGAKLQAFIADILDGTEKVTRRGSVHHALRQKIVQHSFTSNKAYIREAIKAPAIYSGLVDFLRIKGRIETKGQIASAAERLTQLMHNLSPSQLDRLIHPRKRDKSARLNKKL
jgi:hypothetical protein